MQMGQASASGMGGGRRSSYSAMGAAVLLSLRPSVLRS
jgi:hypothetical protein